MPHCAMMALMLTGETGIIAIIGSAATGLISIERVSNNPDEDGRIQEDVPED
jgi:hypothetical protein